MSKKIKIESRNPTGLTSSQKIEGQDPVNNRRALNWSREEETVLVNAVEPHYAELFGAHSAKLDQNRKKLLWSIVTSTVNASSSEKRTTEALKKKWTKLKSEVKVKAATAIKRRQATGGRETDDEDVDEFEERIACLDDSNKKLAKLIGVTGVVGIPGGVDSASISDRKIIKVLTSSDCNIVEGNPCQALEVFRHDPTHSTQLSTQENLPSTSNPAEKSRSLTGSGTGTKKIPEKKSEAKKIGPDMLLVQQNILAGINSMIPIMTRVADALERIANK